MKVLQLNTFDVEGGAALAAWRLHLGLRDAGVDSKMLVQTKTGTDATAIERDTASARALGQLRPWLEALPLLMYRGRPATHWATEWVPTRITEQIHDEKPDIIHLHWVCRGFMSVADIGGVSQGPRGTPVVWTLHDSWAFTGGCHVPGHCTKYRQQCGLCPQLNSREGDDLSRHTWERKNLLWTETPLTIVTPSDWLARCARDSSLFKTRRVEVIPNGIDTSRMAPMPRDEARAELALPQDKKLILLCAMNAVQDTNKGFRHLEEALRKLAGTGWRDRVELVVVGQAAPPTPVDTGVPTRFLGVLKGEEAMRRVYSAADLTVLPSLQENLPNSIMESMACGTPVTAFGIGGIPQLVEHDVTGYLARPQDDADLAAGLEYILSDSARRDRMGMQARLKIEREFDTRLTAKRYHDLYEQLLANR